MNQTRKDLVLHKRCQLLKRKTTLELWFPGILGSKSKLKKKSPVTIEAIHHCTEQHTQTHLYL